MAFLIWNAKYETYYGNSTDDIPSEVAVGDKAYFFDTSKHKVFNGTTFADDIMNTSTALDVGDVALNSDVVIVDTTTDTPATVGANGLYVDVKAIPTITINALPTGSNVIGHVYIDNVAGTPININSIPAGSNAIGTVTINNIAGTPVQVSALPTGSNVIGHVIVDNVAGTPITISTLPAGTNMIGHVTIDNISATPVYISALPAGTNIVGKFTTDQTTHGTTDKVASDLYVGATLVSNTNPVPTCNNYVDIVFHNAASTPVNGTALTVGSYKTLTVEIYGTSSSRTVTFIGISKSGTGRAIQGINLATFSLATSTTGTGEFWQFDITGLDSVLLVLTAVSGGNVTISGRAIA